VPSWTLSTVDIDVLVELSVLPAPPYPLDVPSPGVTFDERRRHVAAVRADLADRGLVHGTEPVGDLGEALTLLATGELVVDGRFSTDRPFDLVGVVRGEQAALAMQTGDTVQLSHVHDHALIGMIVDLLPPARKLAGNSTCIPHEAFTRALTAIARSGDFVEFERILGQAGVRDPDVRLLTELVRADGAAAQFGVATRTPATDVYRERRVWTWYATDAGGVLLGLDSRDSSAWTTLVPADPARVGQYLRNALHDMRYGHDAHRRESRVLRSGQRQGSQTEDRGARRRQRS
jgi:hypothetical protein